MLKIKQALPSEASLLLALSRRALDAECAANPLLSALRRGAGAGFFRFGRADRLRGQPAVGFLAFTGAFDGVFGDCKGVYSPLHGGFFGGSWCSAASARAAAT